jgi:hypothetical protein
MKKLLLATVVFMGLIGSAHAGGLPKEFHGKWCFDQILRDKNGVQIGNAFHYLPQGKEAIDASADCDTRELQITSKGLLFEGGSTNLICTFNQIKSKQSTVNIKATCNRQQKYRITLSMQKDILTVFIE